MNFFLDFLAGVAVAAYVITLCIVVAILIVSWVMNKGKVPAEIWLMLAIVGAMASYTWAFERIFGR